MFNTSNLKFKKTGKEIKQAVSVRLSELKSRLEKRDADLSRFTKDETRLRSYLIRSANQQLHRVDPDPILYSEGHISSEEKEEISQLCKRIFEIEQEINKLTLVQAHLADEQEFELAYQELVAYGFDSNMQA